MGMILADAATRNQVYIRNLHQYIKDNFKEVPEYQTILDYLMEQHHKDFSTIYQKDLSYLEPSYFSKNIPLFNIEPNYVEALMTASEQGNTKMVKQLLKNQYFSADDINRALIRAATPETAKVLIEYKFRN